MKKNLSFPSRSLHLSGTRKFYQDLIPKGQFPSADIEDIIASDSLQLFWNIKAPAEKLRSGHEYLKNVYYETVTSK